MNIHPTEEEFCRRAERGNLVPVWTELIADHETPVGAYERIRMALRRRDRATHTFLLESVEGGESVGRYSFIGGAPRAILRSWGNCTVIEEAGQTVGEERGDPLESLKQYMARFQLVRDPALPRFCGGAVGFLGYDAVAQFERVPVREEDEIGNPDMVFLVTESLIIFDRVRHTIRLVANAWTDGDRGAAYRRAADELTFLREALTAPLPRILLDAGDPVEERTPPSNVERRDFEAAVERAREYIRAGDIIQAVLSQRFQIDNRADSLDVYRALRSVNPSPYMFCLDLGNSALVGASPEVHVRCEDGRVNVRPIAGTRPRSTDPEEDRRLEQELLADPKERAEHIMLVDLARNDIGRVCGAGTVRVPELMMIERYSHVMHIVSDVVGEIDVTRDSYDVMRATFPAGTVSGAPKIRAMEIIAELEKAKRGPYAGAVGYFSFDGNLDSCIVIRTIVLDGNRAYVQAGAGIVADSVPAMEYEETRNKAKGLLAALALAERFRTAREDAP
jgi:anthranilate synthase component I